MKHFASVVTSVMVLASSASATTYTLSNGNFGSQLGSTTFANGDVINIPPSTNVSFTATRTINVSVELNIAGTLNMTPGTKILTLAAGSEANIYPGGTLAGNDADQRLIIGTNNVFLGSGDITAGSDTLTATAYSFGFMTGGGTPLPIRLLSFDASVRSGYMVNINWSAIHDGPASLFNIEQSIDGSSWKNIAVVNARGGDQETVYYSHELQAPRDVKTLLYRLRMQDNDGLITYSSSRSVNAKASAQEATATISTVGNELRLHISGVTADGKSHITVTNMEGKLVYRQAYTSTEAISIPTYTPGLYIVTVTDNASYRIAQMIFM
jgi:hypothetical protein